MRTGGRKYATGARSKNAMLDGYLVSVSLDFKNPHKRMLLRWDSDWAGSTHNPAKPFASPIHEASYAA
jgi:hypothetical protein